MAAAVRSARAGPPTAAPPPDRPGAREHRLHCSLAVAHEDSMMSIDAVQAEAMREHAGAAARLLKAIANEKRLMILCVLTEGELSVGEINERIPVSQSALSQHLAILRRDQLVTTRRDGQLIFYRLREGPVLRLIQTLHGIYCGDPAERGETRAVSGGA